MARWSSPLMSIETARMVARRSPSCSKKACTAGALLPRTLRPLEGDGGERRRDRCLLAARAHEQLERVIARGRGADECVEALGDGRAVERPARFDAGLARLRRRAP